MRYLNADIEVIWESGYDTTTATTQRDGIDGIGTGGSNPTRAKVFLFNFSFSARTRWDEIGTQRAIWIHP